MDSIRTLLIAIPALPLLAAVLTAILGPRVLRGRSHWLTIGALAAASWLSLLLVARVHRAQAEPAGDVRHASFERVVTLWTWASVADAYRQAPVPPGESHLSLADGGIRDFRIDITLRADGLTSMMLAMVTFVATLVAIFAAGYMHGDRGYARFFTYFSLFVCSMTMLVSVSNFLLLYVFWEAVGVCSYLLIGFWYEKPAAAAAGKKAFLVNRVGDFGFALALFLIWTQYGTLNFHDATRDGRTDQAAIKQSLLSGQFAAAGADETGDDQIAGPKFADNDSASDSAGDARPVLVRGVLGQLRIAANDYVGGGVGLAIGLLLMLGACGKSAQFPLHVWLPDAMEGPTPVSALIHAATMVTAGVYMVARCTPLFMVSPEAQLTVSCIGAFTALLAGLIALSQFDLKRVLAYSTVSQLGFMFLGLGTGTFAGVTSSMFHLFTHAFFKALLFLGAGSVMHAMGHIIDMRRFGGLRSILPTTHATFLMGCLALSGIPPFSGFWSKDGILAAVEEKAHGLLHHESSLYDPVLYDPVLYDPVLYDPVLYDPVLYDPVPHDPSATESTRKDTPGENSAAHGSPEVSDGSPPSHGGELAAAQRARYGKIYLGLYYLALATAGLTACYTFRAYYLTFFGALRVPHEAGEHAHESPARMWVPLAILALCAGVAGFVFDQSYTMTPRHTFVEFIGGTPSLAAGRIASTRVPIEFHLTVAGVSTVVALAGWLVATYLYLGEQRQISWVRSVLDFEKPAKWLDVESVSRLKRLPWVAAIHGLACRLGLGRVSAFIGQLILLLVLVLATPFLLGHYLSPYKLSQAKFYVDEIYQLTIVAPLQFLAQVCYTIDRWVVDGMVNLLGRLPGGLGSLMRSLQMGLVPFYALAMLLGALALFAAQLLWAAG